MNRGKWIFKIVAFVLLALVAFGFVTMHLWNWLVPDLFNGPEITFGQTIGLLVLSKIIFSGFGKGGGHHNGQWKSRWKEKLRDMTPEEQERFKQKMMRLKFKMEDKWCGPGKESPKTDSGNSTV